MNSWKRKAEQVDICINKNVNATYNYWDDIQFVHQALPELNLDEIDLATTLFNKKLNAPIIISAMTGGYPGAEKINKRLAQLAEEHQIGLGIGSQRGVFDTPRITETYTVIRSYDIPLVIGNIGAPQLIDQKSGDRVKIEDIKKMQAMIDADLIAIHLNYLQEVVQVEGDTRAKGCFDAIKTIAEEVPIIVKETGAGISRAIAEKLVQTHIKGIDVGGMSGTSFAAVEFYRAELQNVELNKRLGKTFWDWGIPTPVAVIETRDLPIPIIATGGIRSGLDAARALALGASATGIARLLLSPATVSYEHLSELLTSIEMELKCAMFLVGAPTITELRNKKMVIMGKTAEWLDALK
jgi:isopentenyl-diphosphate delta-isomerase